jgi:hypothetical protein
VVGEGESVGCGGEEAITADGGVAVGHATGDVAEEVAAAARLCGAAGDAAGEMAGATGDCGAAHCRALAVEEFPVAAETAA